MAHSDASLPRLTAPTRAASLLLALLFAALPLALLLQGIVVQLLPVPSAPVTEVRLVPLPSPDVPQPRPANVVEARPVAPAPVVAAPASAAQPTIAAAPVPSPFAGTGAGQAPGISGTGSAGAAVPPAPPPAVARESAEGRLFPAVWAEVPSQRLLGRHNPPRARYEGVTGSALLACHVLPSRRLADCKVLRETPEGYGFGEGALDASADFRVVPPMLDGEVVSQGWVAIPVGFTNRKPDRD